MLLKITPTHGSLILLQLFSAFVCFCTRLSAAEVQTFSADVTGLTEVKAVFAGLQLVWLAINAFLFVHFYMAFLVERWFYTRVLLGVSGRLRLCCP